MRSPTPIAAEGPGVCGRGPTRATTDRRHGPCTVTTRHAAVTHRFRSPKAEKLWQTDVAGKLSSLVSAHGMVVTVTPEEPYGPRTGR